MSINIRLSTDISEATAMLAKMEARSKNFVSVFNFARNELRKANAANFGAGGLPSGGWVTPEEDRAWTPLIETGRLFRSLTSLQGSPNEVSPLYAIFGTKVEYAKFHQYGTRDMPKRKVVFEPVGFAKKVGEKAAKHIVGLRGDLLP